MVRHCHHRSHLYHSLGEHAELPEQLVDIWRVLGGHLLDVPTRPRHHSQDPLRDHTPRYRRKKDWLPEVCCSRYDIVVEGIKGGGEVVREGGGDEGEEG